MEQLPTTSAATAAAEAAAAPAQVKAPDAQQVNDQADLECEAYNSRIHNLRLQLLDHMVGFLPKLRQVRLRDFCYTILMIM